MKKILFTLSLLLLNSCASVNSISLTSVPPQRNKVVKSEVSKFIFLGFNFNNDFIDELTNDLKKQCPNGIISGILTKDESISYVFAHTRKVTATGFCVVGSKELHASSAGVGK
jgi:hypothetical protein